MRWLYCFLLCSAVLHAAPLHAQSIGARAALGPASARDAGGVVVLGALLRHGRLLMHLEGAYTHVGGSTADGSARVLAAGAAVGITTLPRATPLRAYALARAGRGLDPREADHVTILGTTLGIERGSGIRLFTELRYDHWLQYGVRHHDLPSNLVGLVVGIGIR